MIKVCSVKLVGVGGGEKYYGMGYYNVYIAQLFNKFRFQLVRKTVERKGYTSCGSTLQSYKKVEIELTKEKIRRGEVSKVTFLPLLSFEIFHFCPLVLKYLLGWWLTGN